MQAHFVNPATGDTYNWLRNPATGDQRGKTRQIQGTANTGQTGRVRQQSDDGDFVLKYEVTVEHKSMRQALWSWYALCRTQTIYFYDHDGDGYEVQIADIQEQPQYRLSAGAPDPDQSHVFYNMTVTMIVYGFLSGVMHDAGVLP